MSEWSILGGGGLPAVESLLQESGVVCRPLVSCGGDTIDMQVAADQPLPS